MLEAESYLDSLLGSSVKQVGSLSLIIFYNNYSVFYVLDLDLDPYG